MKKFWLLFAVLFLAGCESFFFHPSKQLLYNPEICACQPENILIETDEGETLHGWLFRTSVVEPKGTVVFMHGNSRNMSTESTGMLWLLEAGYNLFTFDYRGYGISSGEPSVEGILKDAAEAFDGFMQTENIDKSNIILWGQSLGGAAASYTAANSPHGYKIKILLLDSTFTSWRDIARDQASKMFFTWPFQYPISWFYMDKMSSKQYVTVTKAENILIIHSNADKLIDVKHGKKLYDLTKVNKEFFEYSYAEHARIVLNPLNRPKILDYFDSVLNK